MWTWLLYWLSGLDNIVKLSFIIIISTVVHCNYLHSYISNDTPKELLVGRELSLQKFMAWIKKNPGTTQSQIMNNDLPHIKR